MSGFPERRGAAPPPDGLRDLHRRLSAVLADLTFPAQRWQLIAAAEVYGCDTMTRAILERAPEQRYHTLPELVAVLGAILGGRPVAPVPTPSTALPRRPLDRRAPAHVAPARPAPAARVVRSAPRSPRPAA